MRERKREREKIGPALKRRGRGFKGRRGLWGKAVEGLKRGVKHGNLGCGVSMEDEDKKGRGREVEEEL